MLVVLDQTFPVEYFFVLSMTNAFEHVFVVEMALNTNDICSEIIAQKQGDKVI